METILSQKISKSSACVNLQSIWDERLTFPSSIDFSKNQNLVPVQLPYLMNVFAQMFQGTYQPVYEVGRTTEYALSLSKINVLRTTTIIYLTRKILPLAILNYLMHFSILTNIVHVGTELSTVCMREDKQLKKVKERFEIELSYSVCSSSNSCGILCH